MRCARAVAWVAAAVLFAAAATAQPVSPAKAPEATAPAATAQDPLGRATPRGTVVEFLSAARKGDDKAAALYLNTTLRGVAVERLARQLFVVLDTRLPAKLTQLSDQPEGTITDPRHRSQETIGTITRDDGDLEIVLERVNRAPDGWIWLFSRKTLDAVPDVYDEVGRISIEAVLPAFLVDTRLFGIRLFEWATLVLGPVLLYLVLALLHWAVRRRFPRLLPLPVRLLLLGAAMQWILSVVGFPILVRQLWSGAATLCNAVAAAWLLILLNAGTERYVLRQLSSEDLTGAGSLARVVRRAVDLVIVVAVALATLWSFGVNPTPALAGLGVGGIAVALAAQKTLENVIAGVSLIVDRAVRVGDVLKINDTIGTVVYIGLRSTRIRTLDRTVVTVPNGQIAAMTLEAISARDQFWFHPSIGLDLQTTAEQIRAVVEGTRRLLEEHRAVDRQSIRVRFCGLGAFSLNLDVVAYVMARDVNHFFELQEGMLFGVMAIIRQAGASLATTPPALIAGHHRRP